MNKVNNWLCHRIVESIKESGEISFDTLDLEDSMDRILADYGWCLNLSNDEKELIQKDIYDLALRAETAEVMRSIEINNILIY
ncbi:MAG: hypothetical protein V1859_02275 [archaeon]